MNNQDNSLKNLYLKLFDIVKYSLGSSIDKEKIENVIYAVINEFKTNPFNELLLYFYSESKSNYLAGHITNNVILAIGFGISLNLSDEDLYVLGISAFCHDFGMANFIQYFQKGNQLNSQETNSIKEHVNKSVELFKDIFPDSVIKAVTDVHEYVNGQGYPNGKTNTEISFFSKIISICDVYEALTHPRAFRKEFIPYEAIKMIIKKKNIIFSDQILKKFVEFMSIYPIGSLVYLNTGEIGMVIGSNLGTPTRSIIKILLNPKREIDNSNKTLNLLEDNMIYITQAVDLNGVNEILNILKPRGDFDI